MVDAPPRPRTIAVIEDEASIASAVAARLRSEGYQVEIAGDGPAGVELCEKTRPDLVVLDLMLPGLDGLEVCRRIQRQRATPILMLTARDSETDLVIGLGVGADDYMTKPFSARELVARVGAILRRSDRVDTGADDAEMIRVGDVEIDTASRRVRRDDELVHLTPTEFDLLVYLASRPSRVATRAKSCSSRCGATTFPRARAPSTRTCARCAASSARRWCARCTAWGTQRRTPA